MRSLHRSAAATCSLLAGSTRKEQWQRGRRRRRGRRLQVCLSVWSSLDPQSGPCCSHDHSPGWFKTGRPALALAHKWQPQVRFNSIGRLVARRLVDWPAPSSYLHCSSSSSTAAAAAPVAAAAAGGEVAATTPVVALAAIASLL